MACVPTKSANVNTQCRVCKTPLGGSVPVHFVEVPSVDKFPVPTCLDHCPEHRTPDTCQYCGSDRVGFAESVAYFKCGATARQQTKPQLTWVWSECGRPEAAA